MGENENNSDECGELIALAALAIVVGLPVLIKCAFDWLTNRDKMLKSRQPDGNHLAVK